MLKIIHQHLLSATESEVDEMPKSCIWNPCLAVTWLGKPVMLTLIKTTPFGSYLIIKAFIIENFNTCDKALHFQQT